MTKKIYSTFMAVALFAIGVAMSGCKKDEPQQRQEVKTYKMSVNASKAADNDSANSPRKVLGLSGTTLNATWAVGEQVIVYNETRSAAITGYLEAQTAGAGTTLEGSLTGTIEVGDALTLKFLNPNYTDQLGTLEYIGANCDYATASVTVSSVDGSGNITTTADADFENRQAIIKFTLLDQANDEAISTTELTIEVGGSTYTITPASATSELYVALPGFSSQTISMTATVGSDTYVFEKSGVTLANGQYYTITVNMTKQVSYPTGALPGVFSVGESTQVHFSQGNLRYQASTQTWRFAEKQYYLIGSDNSNISASYSGWIDLFGWGTGSNPTNSSTSYSDYSTFVDWGVNAISNGGNQANLWRTLTKDEWGYLFKTRTDASTKYGQAIVADVHGIIVLPDVYNGTAINTDHSAWDNNTISAEAWAAYEANGAVFLPAAGHRGGTDVISVGSDGLYWSSTPNGEDYAYVRYFDSHYLGSVYSGRNSGRSVRLVR